jgi:O-antigen ligase
LATSSLSGKEGIVSLVRAWSPGALLVSLAVPFLFLHVRYQQLGSVHGVDVAASDVAVLVVVVAAVAAGIRPGFGALRGARWLWAAAAAFLLWLAVDGSAPWRTHLITAAKFWEYALLAPALVLLLRRREDVAVFLGVVGLWSAVATIVGVAQFFGADIAASGTVGRRQASFLGSHDFATLSGAALMIGLFGAYALVGRRTRLVALVAGVLGMIVSGSLAAVLGVVAGVAAGAVYVVAAHRVEWRRAWPLAAAVAVVVVGSLAIRTTDLDQFLRFLGAKPAEAQTTKKIQTYAHRTVLVYIGLRIWEDHPLRGVGWQGSAEPRNFMRYVPDARRKFPREAPQAFPSPAPDRRYGVQNLYVQTLADLGVVGLALLLALFGAAIWLAVRARNGAGIVAASWVVLLLGLWLAQGLVAGVPLDALTWLAFGLVGIARA